MRPRGPDSSRSTGGSPSPEFWEKLDEGPICAASFAAARFKFRVTICDRAGGGRRSVDEFVIARRLRAALSENPHLTSPEPGEGSDNAPRWSAYADQWPAGSGCQVKITCAPAT